VDPKVSFIFPHPCLSFRTYFHALTIIKFPLHFTYKDPEHRSYNTTDSVNHRSYISEVPETDREHRLFVEYNVCGRKSVPMVSTVTSRTIAFVVARSVLSNTLGNVWCIQEHE
jgi:hypothetical protein